MTQSNLQSPGQVIDLVSKFADTNTIHWLLDALENPEQHLADQYFPNRVALVLIQCRPDIVEDELPHLVSLSTRKYIHQLSWVIRAIQSNCQFYNYDLFCSDPVPEPATSGQSPIYTFNAPVGIVNTEGTVIHGNQTGIHAPDHRSRD